MLKNLNDMDLQLAEENDWRSIFFVQRWFEMLHPFTINNYYLSNLNAHTALKELYYVCDSHLNNKLRVEYIAPMHNEARILVGKDEAFKYNAPILYKTVSRNISQKRSYDTHQLQRLKNEIAGVLPDLERNYLNWIINCIEIELKNRETCSEEEKQNTLIKLNDLLSSLVSELIDKGWSAQSLFDVLENSKKGGQIDDSFWDDFFGFLRGNPKKYLCVFKVKKIDEDLINKAEQVNLKILNGSTLLDDTDIDGLDKYISEKFHYIIQEIESYDYYSAWSNCLENVISQTDILKFYGFKLEPINEPIIIDVNARECIRNVKQFIKSILPTKAPNSFFTQVLTLINDESKLEVTIKAKRIYQYFRISNESRSFESKYLNLWVALESFVKSSQYNSDIWNVSEIVEAAVASRYIYSLVRNFQDDCTRCGVNIDFLDSYSTRNEMVAEIIRQLKCKIHSQVFIEKCSSKNTLLEFRCRELINVLTDNKSIGKSIKSYSNAIVWDLQRLYRIRNTIVHAANTHRSLVHYVRNLLDYLQTTVQEVLTRLTEFDYRTLEEVFAIIRDNHLHTIEWLNNEGTPPEINKLISVILDGIVFAEKKKIKNSIS